MLPRILKRDPGGMLAFDLAKMTGWSYATSGGLPVSGEHELPDVSSWGRQGAALTDLLWHLIEGYQPSALAYEAPFTKPHDTANNFRTGFGLASRVEEIGYRANLPVWSDSPKKCRAIVLLDENLPAKQAKKIVMQFCRDRGWQFEGDNDADAHIVREAAMSRRRVPGALCPKGEWDRIRFWRPQMELVG